jgi:hypothetical protein
MCNQATIRRCGTALAYALSTAACTTSGSISAVAPSEDGGGGSPVDATATTDAAPHVGDSGAAPPKDGGSGAKLSASAIDFGGVACGGAQSARSLTITAPTMASLAVSATTTNPAFTVTPSTLSIGDGGTGTLTVSALVPASATAGVSLAGSLVLFTDDATHGNVTLPLTATPTGATLSFAKGAPASIAFPTSEIGTPATTTFDLVNVGNAGAAFSFDAPTSGAFSISTASAQPTTLAAGATWPVGASFTATSSAPVTGTVALAAKGPICGPSLTSIQLSGQGTLGQLAGWPTAPVDFGPADCGGAAPATQSFTLQNVGSVGARITSVSLSGAAGFATTAAVGREIPASGGELLISVSAPPVPSPSSLTPLTSTLSIETDADSAPHLITLTEEPRGAILSFDTSQTPSFGDFGPVVLLDSASQPLGIANAGNGAAKVAVATAITADGGSSPFSVSAPTTTIGAQGTQSESVVFSPVAANGVSGTLSLSTSSPLCAPLPAPLPLSGTGLGGGPVVSQTSLQFLATCGGPAPQTQSLQISNDGTSPLTWSLGALTGPGAGQYTVTTSAAPGTLAVGESTTIYVKAAAVPSPAPDPSPAALVASMAITTDVPLDPPHVVTLGEVPLGDQLAFSVPSLRFGQPPIGTTLAQTFAVENWANPGSPAANVSLTMQGTGAGAYTLAPGTATSIAAGGGASPDIDVDFTPPSAIAYPASVALSTSDALCTALPTTLPITGTGAQGRVLVSPGRITFGTNPADPVGLVDCGKVGPARTLSVSNVGNDAFQVTSLSLGRGASSPYALSGEATNLPSTVPIGGSVSLVVTPSPIPANVANPNDASAYADTITIVTSAALDVPHSVPLVMQPRGAIIASTPVATTWSFGTVAYGSIGTVTTAIENHGNAPATVTLQGLLQPGVFGIENNPTTASPNAVTSVVGQFVPPSQDGSWSDRGSVVVTADAFCAPLPAQWSEPAIALAGASNGASPVTLSGALDFPATSCGSAPPPAAAVTLSNTANVAYAFTASLEHGSFYTLSTSSGSVAASGTASIVVTPKAVLPGPGVEAGSAPYADELLVIVKTSPATSFVVPISWELDGAVLSLPEGAGPASGTSGAFYPADSSGATQLPMKNTGTASASVSFAVAPASLIQLSPSPPIEVIPGILASPVLASASSAPVCPTTASGTVTFLYSGPVCQPFPSSAVSVRACVGTL